MRGGLGLLLLLGLGLGGRADCIPFLFVACGLHGWCLAFGFGLFAWIHCVALRCGLDMYVQIHYSDINA